MVSATEALIGAMARELALDDDRETLPAHVDDALAAIRLAVPSSAAVALPVARGLRDALAAADTSVIPSPSLRRLLTLASELVSSLVVDAIEQSRPRLSLVGPAQ